MDILDDMGVSKLSANVFLKANYSFNDEKVWKKKHLICALLQVVPAGGSSTIHVSFTPLILSCSASQRCLGYALGYMTLDSKVCECEIKSIYFTLLIISSSTHPCYLSCSLRHWLNTK